MSMLMQALGNPLAYILIHALGWTLLHFCWQGAIVATALWCALQLIPARSSQSRYAAACSAFVILIILPVVTFAHLAAAGERSGRTTGSFVAVDPAILLQVNVVGSLVSWPARIAMALDHSIPWLLAAWLAGAIFFILRLNFGLVLTSRLKSTATEPVSSQLSQLFDLSRQRLGIHRTVGLLHSARVHVPTVIGWLSPVVLLPATCLTGLSTGQIEAIFFHELAHVRRHDYLVSVLQSIAESLLFYHPAVWWISREVRRERECCCDQIAVANGGDVLAYAKALSYLEERRAAFPDFALGANGGILSTRIRRLLGCNPDRPASQATGLILLAVMLAAAGSYVATFAHAAQAKAQPAAGLVARSLSLSGPSILLAPLHAIGLAQQQSVAITAQAPTSRGGVDSAWLGQDVVYIITPQERADYLQLKTDAERDTFISQFWTRRDPPGSPANTFKSEHYARIAYSNQHFAAAGNPGWTTDRGRAYIVLGKPFEVESHPAGSADSAPFEIWQYNTTGGQQVDAHMRFIDTAGDGNYRLSSTRPISQPAPSTAKDDSPAYPQNTHTIDFNGVPLGRIGTGVSSPVVIRQVNPEYTKEARKKKLTGVVLVNLIVDQKGLPQNVHVVHGIGMGLDENAVKSVKQYRFKPAMENAKPVPVELNVEVNFQFF